MHPPLNRDIQAPEDDKDPRRTISCRNFMNCGRTSLGWSTPPRIKVRLSIQASSSWFRGIWGITTFLLNLYDRWSSGSEMAVKGCAGGQAWLAKNSINCERRSRIDLREYSRMFDKTPVFDSQWLLNFDSSIFSIFFNGTITTELFQRNYSFFQRNYFSIGIFWIFVQKYSYLQRNYFPNGTIFQRNYFCNGICFFFAIWPFFGVSRRFFIRFRYFKWFLYHFWGRQGCFCGNLHQFANS